MRFATGKDLLAIKSLQEKKLFEIPVGGLVALNNLKIFVAVHNSNIVGFCRCGIKPGAKNEGYISKISVIKGFKGSGVGHKLLGAAHSFFAAKKVNTVFLTAHKKLLGFYEKAGYKTVLDKEPFIKMARFSPKIIRKKHL